MKDMPLRDYLAAVKLAAKGRQWVTYRLQREGGIRLLVEAALAAEVAGVVLWGESGVGNALVAPYRRYVVENGIRTNPGQVVTVLGRLDRELRVYYNSAGGVLYASGTPLVAEG